MTLGIYLHDVLFNTCKVVFLVPFYFQVMILLDWMICHVTGAHYGVEEIGSSMLSSMASGT